MLFIMAIASKLLLLFFEQYVFTTLFVINMLVIYPVVNRYQLGIVTMWNILPAKI
jgi:hypothetical protein